MIPSRKQWQKWSLPIKYSTVGLLVGIISIFIGFASFFISGSRDVALIDFKAEVKEAYKDIQTENNKDNQYINRYLKDRIADIENVELMEININPIARMHYHSYWEKLTLHFRASIEIRQIFDLNKKYMEDEGWKKATLLNGGEDSVQTIFLGESEFVDVTKINRGGVYELRMVDFNYDSDEPPTLPFRFQVL